LDEGQADLGERVPKDAAVLAEAIAETIHQAPQGIDGEARRRQVRWGSPQVDGGQLEQSHGVVGHHAISRYLSKSLARLGQLGLYPRLELRVVELCEIRFVVVIDVVELVIDLAAPRLVASGLVTTRGPQPAHGLLP